MDSSATGRVIRRAVAGSVLCAGVAAIALRLRTRKRAVAGPETEWSSEQEIRMAEQRDALLGGSRLLGVFDVAAVASLGVWRTAHVRRVLQRVPSLDLPETVRAGAGIILIATFDTYRPAGSAWVSPCTRPAGTSARASPVQA